MNMLLFIGAFLLCLAAAAEPPADACVLVRARQIAAGDLVAKIPALASVDPLEPIAHAPAAGITRWLSGAELRKVLDKFGIQASGIPPVCVQQISSPVSRWVIEAALLKALQDAGYQEGAESLRLLAHPQTPFPEGTIVFSVRDLPHRGSSTSQDQFLWKGTYACADGSRLPFWVRVRLHLKSGADKLSPEFRGLPGRDQSSRPLWTERSVAARTQGAILDKTPAEIVRKGQRVRVITLAAGIRLESPGRAVSSGGEGEVVTVENTTSHKRFPAVVWGAGVVMAGMENQHVP